MNRVSFLIDGFNLYHSVVDLRRIHNTGSKWLDIYQLCNSYVYLFGKNGFPQKKNPVHLLFHMATGSEKTILMATNILYLYEQGYRNFIFFVNSTNIIEKTKVNFLAKDKWKEEFLEEVQEDSNINPSTLYDCELFKLIGLPFYNHCDEQFLKFEESFIEETGLKQRY